MATYIMLARTPKQQGGPNLEGAPDALAEEKQLFQAMGAELEAIYAVMGHYDLVKIVEAPDAETVAKISMALGAQTGLQIETLRAFTEDELLEMLSSLAAFAG